MFCGKHNAREGPVIQFLNVKPNDQFTYSIVLIRGQIINYNHRMGVTHLQIDNENITSCIESAEITTDGKFKVAVELAPGMNHLTFQFCCVTNAIALVFNQRKNPHYLLRIFYIICQNHDGHFQTKNNADNSIECACEKINLAIRMVQCLYAEMMTKNGFARKTFEFVKCVPFYSSLSIAEARQWDQNQLWKHHAKEILAQENDTQHRYKYFGILASTLCENGTIKGNTALGCGDVALFGSGTMHAWPMKFAEIQRCFQDDTLVDGKLLMNDSNGRNSIGGCYATALGSLTHEIGHIFDLGHSRDGVMGNDIDYVNRMFTIEKNPRDLPRRQISKCSNNLKQDISTGGITNNRRLTTIKKSNPILANYHCRRNDDLTFLTENCAIMLNAHKWFNQTDETETSSSSIQYDSKRKIIESMLPLALVEIRSKESGMCMQYYRFDVCSATSAAVADPFNFTIAGNVIEQNYDLIAIDKNGHIMKWSS
ncbi:putative zinc metalloproteinase YIL108W [Contarinia nasturtii]|uniref:putative zinc metalloproteinase YIL108W n=1 Tax=Contarinia nasturtii TaxID=265458 RepID=UPI0012D4A790|nr:putative zinc metalloproteinase YIL108W [Contarinia nasturtii]